MVEGFKSILEGQWEVGSVGGKRRRGTREGRREGGSGCECDKGKERSNGGKRESMKGMS